MMRSINSFTVGMSWISPTTMPRSRRPHPSRVEPSPSDKTTATGRANAAIFRLVPFSRLDIEKMIDALVFQHASYSPTQHHQHGVEFAASTNAFSALGSDRRFLGGDEPRANVHAGGALDSAATRLRECSHTA